MDKSYYDKIYYDDGVCSGKSCYVNYRWMPELTIKMAYNFIRYLDIDSSNRILDYGCAMGYLVKAFRILDIDAYGCDISEYAISHADADVRDHCYLIDPDYPQFEGQYDWIITKDVLEHMEFEQIKIFLNKSHEATEKMFHIIPLGDDDGRFVVPEYHDDPSHIQIHTVDWWNNIFESCGWMVKSFAYSCKGIKENWTSKYPDGNGFFVLENKGRSYE